MNLSELTSEVYTITRRSDLVEKTSAAIRAATLLAHHSDFYSKDIVEVGIQFDTAAYRQSLDTDIIPRYRKVKYVRKYYNAANPPFAGSFLTILTPEELLDEYGVERSNIAYEAGSYLQLSSSDQLQHLLVGAYVSPDVTGLNYNSWIANNYPWLIIHHAAAHIFAGIGNKEDAKIQEGYRNEQFQTFQAFALATAGS